MVASAFAYYRGTPAVMAFDPAETPQTRILMQASGDAHIGAETYAGNEQALRRLDTIEHVGDIALISLYDPETGEIAAFEELIGAHGGLGGAQTRPFLLYPADWELDEPIAGLAAVRGRRD